ncbi:MAG TPA: hypothetical protein VF487_09165 [Chitinophagaceae bacterium]
MKKVLFLLSVSLLMLAAFAQSEKYTGAMKKNIANIDSAFIKNEAAMLVDAANSFERIGDAEKTQWLPYYYAAYCQLMYSFMKNDPANNDVIGDKADQLLAKAETLEKSNSEISLLKAMSASVHMMVNPMQRWMVYGPKVQQLSQEAITLDPTNPRPYWFNGVSLKNTPEQFGGGCNTAKPQFEKAVTLFAAFKPASELHPNWGRQVCERDFASCK